MARLCLSGEEPRLLGAGQGFRGQLVCKKHHLCLRTIQTPSQVVSPSHSHHPHPGPGLQGVCDGGWGFRKQNSSFPGLCSSLTRRNFLRLEMQKYLEYQICIPGSGCIRC